MATHSSILLAWKIPWTEELGRLHGVTRVGHDRATSLSLSLTAVRGTGVRVLHHSCQ